MLSSAQFKLSAEKHFLLCLPWKKKIEKPIKKKTLWELKLFKKLETFISIHPSITFANLYAQMCNFYIFCVGRREQW